MTDARRQESERELAQALRAAREQIAERYTSIVCIPVIRLGP